jgi:hypothetical protein
MFLPRPSPAAHEEDRWLMSSTPDCNAAVMGSNPASPHPKAYSSNPSLGFLPVIASKNQLVKKNMYDCIAKNKSISGELEKTNCLAGLHIYTYTSTNRYYLLSNLASFALDPLSATTFKVLYLIFIDYLLLL